MTEDQSVWKEAKSSFGLFYVERVQGQVCALGITMDNCVNASGVVWVKEENRMGQQQHCCLEVSKRGERRMRKSEHSCLPHCQRALSWAQPSVLGRGVREGQRNGRQRVGPVNKSHVKKVEKESGDRARGKGVGAQACRTDSPTCRSAFQQRSWPWNL